MKTLNRHSIRVALLAGLILMGTGWLRAQGGGATIQGRVSDTQQLAIATARVELKDAQGRIAQTVLADGTGYYMVSGVPAGTYTVTFANVGFETNQQGPVAVAAGQILSLDVILRPSTVEESVTVVAEIDRSIATKTEIPASEVPVTIQTVPQEIIQRQGLTDLVAVVNNTPGTYSITQYNVYNYFFFRGFALTKDPGSTVLLNGLRLEGNRINTQINSIESVEILKGPSSMLYGTEALGGLISIVQKKPLSTPLFEAAFSAGRWGMRGAEMGMTGPLGTENLLGRLDVAYSQSDGYRAGYERLNVTPALYWRISPSDQLNIHMTYNQDEYELDAGIPLLPDASTADFPLRYTTIPDVPLDRRYNTPGNFEKATDPVFQATYQRTLTEMVRFRQSFQYQYRSDEYWQSEGLTVFFDNPTSVVRENLYFNHFDNALATQSDLLADFDALFRHQVLVGFEYDRLEHETRRSAAASGASVPDIDLFNPVETATLISSFPASRYDQSRNQTSAIYFQDYMRLHPRIQFLVSGRYDAYDRRTQRGTADPIEFDQNPFTYRVALNAQVAPPLSLYTSYGTSFTAQTGLSIDGEPLDPETGWQYEAGARLNLLGNRVTVDGSGYHIVRKNVVVTRGPDSFDQGGQQSSSGFELEVRARASQRLSLFANYGFTEAQFDDFVATDFNADFDEFFVDISGNVPRFVPRHTARVWGTYEFPRGFGASAGVYYVAKRAADDFNYFSLDDYTIWDAALYYRRTNMEYAVNFKNIGNRKNYFVSSIIWNGTQLYPGPPFDVSATIRFRFQ